MDPNPLDPTGEKGRQRIQQIYDDAAAGRYVGPNSSEELAAMWNGNRAKEWNEMVERTFTQPPPTDGGADLVSGVVGILLLLVLAAVVWGWFAINPSVEDFSNRNSTDPRTATLVAKDDLAHKKYVEARHWFEVGASNGGAEAQFNLGLMYYRGLGGPAARTEAMGLISKAAGNGYLPAKKWLARTGRQGARPSETRKAVVMPGAAAR
jgi:TPR repeat protein